MEPLLMVRGVWSLHPGQDWVTEHPHTPAGVSILEKSFSYTPLQLLRTRLWTT